MNHLWTFPGTELPTEFQEIWVDANPIPTNAFGPSFPLQQILKKKVLNYLKGERGLSFSSKGYCASWCTGMRCESRKNRGLSVLICSHVSISVLGSLRSALSNWQCVYSRYCALSFALYRTSTLSNTLAGMHVFRHKLVIWVHCEAFDALMHNFYDNGISVKQEMPWP